MNLTENFTLEELTESEVAKRYNIKNDPNTEETENLKVLAQKILQPVRNHFGKPVTINSGFRCNTLNSNLEIGGEPTSQHVKGEAADFVVEGVSLIEVFLFTIANLEFDQCIYEFGRWIHCSHSSKKNRRQKLVAKRINGKKKYVPYVSVDQLR